MDLKEETMTNKTNGLQHYSFIIKKKQLIKYNWKKKLLLRIGYC